MGPVKIPCHFRECQNQECNDFNTIHAHFETIKEGEDTKLSPPFFSKEMGSRFLDLLCTDPAKRQELEVSLREEITNSPLQEELTKEEEELIQLLSDQEMREKNFLIIKNFMLGMVAASDRVGGNER